MNFLTPLGFLGAYSGAQGKSYLRGWIFDQFLKSWRWVVRGRFGSWLILKPKGPRVGWPGFRVHFDHVISPFERKYQRILWFSFFFRIRLTLNLLCFFVPGHREIFIILLAFLFLISIFKSGWKSVDFFCGKIWISLDLFWMTFCQYFSKAHVECDRWSSFVRFFSMELCMATAWKLTTI